MSERHSCPHDGGELLKRSWERFNVDPCRGRANEDTETEHLT